MSSKHFMIELRSLFVSHPELNHLLTEMLADGNNQDIPLEQRSFVKSLVGLYGGGNQNYLNLLCKAMAAN